jgi:drug/metabolite transporter (DMT)-like permease
MNRTRFYLLGFTVLAICDTTTQVSFKLASLRAGELRFDLSWILAAAHSPWIYIAMTGYVAAFAMWMTLLQRAPVGPAFAASHIDIVTVLLVSMPLFGERLNATQLVGAFCIIAGILFLALNAEPHSRDDELPATPAAILPESPAGDRSR